MHRDGLGPQALREGPKAKMSNVKCSGVWVTPKTKSLKSEPVVYLGNRLWNQRETGPETH